MPLTPLLYGSGALLSGLIAISIFLSYRRSGNRALFFLFLSFLFLSLHSLSLSLPGFFVGDDPLMVGRGYVLGMVFLFMLLIAAFQVQGSINREFVKKHGFIVNIVLAGIGALVVGILIYDLPLPVFSSRGVIFWNANPAAAWAAGITCLVYGLIWADFFHQARLQVSGHMSKLKMLVLSIDGIMLGLSAVLVFTSGNETLSLIGHSLFIVACLLTLIVFLFSPKTL